jgi:hypothetical protein
LAPSISVIWSTRPSLGSGDRDDHALLDGQAQSYRGRQHIVCLPRKISLELAEVDALYALICASVMSICYAAYNAHQKWRCLSGDVRAGWRLLEAMTGLSALASVPGGGM